MNMCMKLLKSSVPPRCSKSSTMWTKHYRLYRRTIMKLRIVSLMFLVGVLLFGACQSGKGKVVAKIKGLKITRAEIDSVFGVAPDKQPDAAKVKGYLKEKLDQQALYLQALKMDFHKQLENKAILRNIQMIESANYFSSEV